MGEPDAPRGHVEKGAFPFTIESSLVRELGERLVRQPDVAVLELVKNAYDADATFCSAELTDEGLVITDDGTGMTLSRFEKGWMRLGTSSKGMGDRSPVYGRRITGEKGIGRLAVRFLGGTLKLTSVADDPERGMRTKLEATFDWAAFDTDQDLGKLLIPFTLTQAKGSERNGTRLVVGRLKDSVEKIDWKAVRTGSMGIVSPFRSLLKTHGGDAPPDYDDGRAEDPGFEVRSYERGEDLDLADALLSHFLLRADVSLDGSGLRIDVYRRNRPEPALSIRDLYTNSVDWMRADIRFFPRRANLFTGAPTDGRQAYSWIRGNSGVKVFDRGFQVRPYGTGGDDWLQVSSDAARNLRKPGSSLTQTHLPMAPEVMASDSLNWMLRLPESAQLVGAVSVRGRREGDGPSDGLIAAADREGFLETPAFFQLRDVIRGAVEMMAFVDRELSLEEERAANVAKLESSRQRTKEAVAAIEADGSLTERQRSKIVEMLEESQDRVEREQQGAKEREQQLEIMSLLGVVAGFMTHEFGVALSELKAAQALISELEGKIEGLEGRGARLAASIDVLKDFGRYSRAYIGGVRRVPESRYPAWPRFNHVRKAFAHYAERRDIRIEIDVDRSVEAPLVPAPLYDGIAQNLLTNSLKAVTASTKTDDRRIVFRAWNEERWHRLQVSDTGTGIPEAVRNYVFDPLFTTTDSRRDPLGSGMGLGLALVRRASSAFGGKADLVAPPPGFSTCVEVRFPLTGRPA